MEESKEKKNRLSAYAKYSGLAFQMIGVILIGSFGGIKLDEYLNTLPLFTIVFTLIAVCLAMGLVIKDFLKKKKE